MQRDLVAPTLRKRRLPIKATSVADLRITRSGSDKPCCRFTRPGVSYYGETLGDRVAWLRRPHDKLVVVMGLNSSATTPKDVIAPLYESILKNIEPSFVTLAGRRSKRRGGCRTLTYAVAPVEFGYRRKLFADATCRIGVPVD